MDVYTSSLDLTGATSSGPPTRISPTELGQHTSPAYSPNGLTIAYMTIRESPGRTNEIKTLTIQDRLTGHAYEIPTRLSWLEGYPPRWMPDSVHVVVWGIDLADHAGYFKVDTHTGEMSTIVLDDVYDGPPSWVCSPDGQTFFYVAKRGVIARDLASGAESVAVAIGQWSGIHFVSVSPDSRTLAFVAGTGSGASQSLEVQALNGTPRELVRVHSPESLVLDAWTPNGNNLLFSRFRPVGPGETRPPRMLWRVAASGGEPQDLHLASGMGGMNSAALAPDGRQIAYTLGTRYWQLLAVDQFLPPARRVP
jgi:Tol biopolymer transport system component